MEARTAQPGNFRRASTYAGLNDLLHGLPKAVDAALLADVLAECATPGDTLIVGVTGSVAAGKTTLCSAIASHLRSTMRVETISTDGFLYSNDALAQKGLSLRKGYPDSYDTALLSGALQRARWGPVRIPGYSHATYDLAPELDCTIDRPDILIVEGLGLSTGPKQRDPSALLDLLVYVDASEQDLETWFAERFMRFWREAEANPNSFYARFRSMNDVEAEAFARTVWSGINLPNLREHIASSRTQADLVIRKCADHRMQLTIASLTSSVS